MLIWRRIRDVLFPSALVSFAVFWTLALSGQLPFSSAAARQAVHPYSTPNVALPGEGFWVFLSAVFTGLLALYAFRQFVETRRSAERQLRAYVFPRPVGLRDYQVGQKPILDIKLVNFGQTPAYHFKQANRGGIKSFPLDEPIPKTRDEQPETQPLAPSDHSIASVQAPQLTAATLAAITAGTRALYFIGEIEYHDAFGKPRWVKYCFYSGGDIPIGEVATNKGGNSTDSDPPL